MPRSRVIAASSVAFLAAGIGFGSPSLLVPGFALLFGVVGLGAWVRLARARLRVRSARGPWSVTEGQNYPLRVSIEGARIPSREPGWSIRACPSRFRSRGFSPPDRC